MQILSLLKTSAILPAIAMLALAGGCGGGKSTAAMKTGGPNPPAMVDTDSDGVPDNRDFYPHHANAGLAAGDVEPRRYAAGDTLAELLANPRNTFRAYSATIRRWSQDGVPQFVRLNDRNKVVSVASDGDFGFHITYRDENAATPEKTVHLRKTDLADQLYRQTIGDGPSSYSYWSQSGVRFDGSNYGPLRSNPYTFSVLDGPGFRSWTLFGLETPPTDLPTSTATYRGIIHARHFDNDLVRSERNFSSSSIRSALRGNISLTADFAANELTGRIDGMRIQRPGETDLVDLPTTGFDIAAGSIEGSQYSATMTGTDTDAGAPLSESMRGFEGRMLGSFFGAEGERANSVFSASRSMEGGNGVIIGAVYTSKQ